MRLNFARLDGRSIGRIGAGMAALAIVAAAAVVLKAAQDDRPERGASLMETLAKWKYPGSTMLEGATMSDGGNPLLQSVKCEAVLTTPDPVERVFAY